MKLAAGIATGAPTIGPAIITLFGVQVPVMALFISVIGLMLARVIAPPPLRKLNRREETCLTLLLLVILFLIVTGELGAGEPLGVGMAGVWGIGLGLSGLLAVELFGDRVLTMIKAMFGIKHGD